MSAFTDVIAAVSTPPGKGGVAIIRASGYGAVEIAERIFKARSGKRISDVAPRVAIYGHIVDSGEVLDDVLLTWFSAGSSYTGEETVEISCHGGMLVTRTVLETVLRAGARAAEPGEFTRRAFINGRISLTEAEAIGELLSAESREQLKLTSSPARKRLTEAIGEIRRQITEIISSIYARIDYPDEDLGEFDDAELFCRLNAVKTGIGTLTRTYRTGRAIAEGISTVICGKPNVGKSTLYNLLVGEDAAIVTEIPGTTRDVLERSVPLGRVMLRLADTAGMRGGDIDAVERMGIEKSRKMIEKCELLFTIFDISRPFDDEDINLLDEVKRSSATKICILNKSDMECRLDTQRVSSLFDAVVTVSAKKSEAETLDLISDTVDRLFTDERIKTGEDAILSSARQHSALLRAADFISMAIESIAVGYPQDAVSSDVEHALGAIAEVDGLAVSEEVVADIFSRFCVGK